MRKKKNTCTIKIARIKEGREVVGDLVVFAEVGRDGCLVVAQLALYQHVLALLYVSRKRLLVDARQRHAAHLADAVQLEVHL